MQNRTYLAIATVLALSVAVTACQDDPTDPGVDSTGFESPSFAFDEVSEGTTVDPDRQKIRAELAPVGNRVPGASGRVIFNDVKGAEKVVVQANVWDMEPETEYELHVAVHNVEPIFNFGTFTTDEDGDGSLHASVPFGTVEPFDIINVRIPNQSGSRQITSWPGDGGSLTASTIR
jgi:hypothetical protein